LLLLASAIATGGDEWAHDPCRFGSTEEAVFVNLDSCRPAPIPTEAKAGFLRQLPEKGRVDQLNSKEQAMMANLDIILVAYGRSGRIDVQVIDLPIAWAGLHDRSVILISRLALGVLKAEELQAVMAHELAHEYVWNAFDAARLAGESERMTNLELVCDVVAARMLTNLSIAPSRLADAIEKMVRFNVARNYDKNGYHPVLAHRRKLIRSLAVPRQDLARDGR
jgi:hypothetical protein